MFGGVESLRAAELTEEELDEINQSNNPMEVITGKYFGNLDVQNSLDTFKSNRQRALLGYSNSMPLGFPRFDKVYSGISRGDVILEAAGSNVGKSKLAKYIAVTNPYEQLQNFDKDQADFRTFYFGLEESKEEFINSIVANRLHRKFNVNIAPDQLNSKGNIVNEETLKLIDSDTEYYNDLFSKINFVEMETNPYKITKMIRNYAVESGTFYFEGEKVIPPSGSWKDFQYDDYQPHNPNLYIFVVIDHIGVINNLKGLDQRQTIDRFTFSPMRLLFSKVFKFIPIVVQQLNANVGSVENIKADQILPSHLHLGDGKSSYRNVLTAFGLCAPNNYSLRSYLDYDVTILKDKFRVFNIFKNRNGQTNVQVPLCFYGHCDMFYELPNARKLKERDDYEQVMEQIYRSVLDMSYKGKLKRKK